jgi:hypothetical protein
MTLQSEPTTTYAAGQRPAHPLVPAGRVNGKRVFNTVGDKLGEVEDVAIDKLSGQVAYAILSFGGFLGLGEDYFPVPWSLLTFDPELGGFVIPFDKEELKDAPRINREELSGWDDTAAREAIFGYYNQYGAGPYWV